MDVNLPALVRSVLYPATCEPEQVRYRCPVCGFGAKTVDGIAGHQWAEDTGRTTHHTDRHPTTGSE